MPPAPAPCPQAHATQLLEGLLQQQAPSRWLAEPGTRPAALNHVLGIFCWCRMHTSHVPVHGGLILAALVPPGAGGPHSRILQAAAATEHSHRAGWRHHPRHLPHGPGHGREGLAEEQLEGGQRAPVALACCALVLSCPELLGQLCWRLRSAAAAEQDLLRML